MGQMRWKDIEPYERSFWDKNQIQRIQKEVRAIDFNDKKLIFSTLETLSYDYLILATGSVPNWHSWPGQELQGVCGLYHKQDLEEIELLSSSIQRAVVVGGGLIGIELAEMFHSRNIPVTMLVREKSYMDHLFPHEESALLSRHIVKQGIDVRFSNQLHEILGNGEGRVAAIRTSAGQIVDCNFVGLTTGVRPNIDFLRESPLECDYGILVNEYLETNLPGIYAIGDCAQVRNPVEGRRAIEPLWYTGRKMGEVLASNLSGKRQAYKPGIWFNSAKFFDIEYQVYGHVPNEIKPPMDSLYWEAPDGMKSIRLVFDSKEQCILGFNLLGIRFRQEVCEKWISQKTKIEEVLGYIRLAFFDPEFYLDYAKPLLEIYFQKSGKRIQLKSNGSLNAVLRFLKS